MNKLKKLMACAVLSAVCLMTQLGTPIPAYAADAPSPDTGIKVATCKLYGDNYYDLSIVGNKLIAKGTWARRADPTTYNIALQLTPPILYTSPSIDGDGLASTYIGNRMLKSASRSWALEETIPVIRDAECKGDKVIELSIDLSGLGDGLYNLRELVTKGDKYDSYYGEYTVIVVQGGQANLQIFFGDYCSALTDFNSSANFSGIAG